MGKGAPAQQNAQDAVIRPFFYCLAASVALNAAAMMGVDRAFVYEGQKIQILRSQKLLQAERDKLPFEFIESPQIKSARPSESKKMSNRDSLSRDRSAHPPSDNGAPLMKKTGPADQLAQAPARPESAVPSKPSKPQQEMKKAAPSANKQQKPSLQEKTPPAKPSDKKETKQKEGPGAEIAAHKEAPPEQTTPNKPAERPAPEDRKKTPAHQAQTGRQQLSGNDHILTQGMTRTKSRGASLNGVTSFDAMGSDMGIYMKNLKERIWLAWFPYLSFQYPSDFQAADAVVSLTLDANGDLKMVRLVDSYGSPMFASFCTEAVQRAGGFGKIPREILAILGKDELEIKFAFHYR